MSGYAIVFSACFTCGSVIGYNPHKVPSVKDSKGVRQPLCAGCVKAMQTLQKEKGLPVWADPQPGSYEGLPEEEL